MCLTAMLASAAIAYGDGENRNLSLVQAVEIARLQNPDLEAAAQEVSIAQAELKRASYISPFDLQGDNTANYRSRSNRSGAQDWRVGIAQQFEVFGQRELRKKSATIGVERSVADLRDQARLLTAAVKLNFLDAIRASRRLALLSELEDLDQRLLAASRTRVDAGEISHIDFNLAQVRYGQTRRALLQGRELYRLQCSSLGRLLGGQAGPEPQPTGDYQPHPLTQPLDLLIARAREQRPDLRSRQLELARLETEASLNSRLNLPNPIVGFYGGHELNTERFGGVTLGFSVPLFNRRTGEAERIAAQRGQASSRLRAIELDVERDVRDAHSRYLAAVDALSVYESDIVAPARESFGLLERAFTEGKIDLLRLSIAEREAFQAQDSYLDAWFDVLAAETALELATGGAL